MDKLKGIMMCYDVPLHQRKQRSYDSQVQVRHSKAESSSLRHRQRRTRPLQLDMSTPIHSRSKRHTSRSTSNYNASHSFIDSPEATCGREALSRLKSSFEGVYWEEKKVDGSPSRPSCLWKVFISCNLDLVLEKERD